MTEPLTKEEFIVRFKAHMCKHAGFTAFDDGVLVADYADEVAPTYWEEECYRDEGPEECADGDMSYWGEE